MEMGMKRIANECFFAWVESEIKSGRSVKFRVKGNSMMPLLRNGKDEVVVGPYDKEELKLFDVILFRQTDRYVLHRIIQKRDSRYLMQGDGVCRFYEECEDTDIIGVVRKVCRPSGKKIETDSMCWRLGSRLWLGLGGCRGMVLRVLNRLGCCLLFLTKSVSLEGNIIHKAGISLSSFCRLPVHSAILHGFLLHWLLS